MEYLTFEHKKELRFSSRVSLRSFFVENAIGSNKGIKVFHKGKIMTLSPDDLQNKGVHNKNSTHTAQFDGYGIKRGQQYYLIDYTFISDDTPKKEEKSEVKKEQLLIF